MGKFGSIVTSLAGAGIGFAIGGPSGAKLGFAIGNMIGGIAFAQDNIPSSVSLPDLALPKATRGSVIPYIYGGIPVGETRGGVQLSGVFMDGPSDGYVTKTVETRKVKTGIPFRKKKKVAVDVYSLTCAIAIADATVAPVQADQIKFGGDVVYDRYGTSAATTTLPVFISPLIGTINTTTTTPGTKGYQLTYDPVTQAEIGNEIELYRGTWNQMPSPALQALHPEGVPAYRGTAYLVIKNLKLEKYGNAIPEIKIICSNGITYTGEIIFQHLKLAGVPEDHIDIEDANDHIQGAFQNVFGPGRSLCEQIATFAGVALVEFDDKIRAVSRATPYIVNLTRDDIGAHNAGEAIPSLVKNTVNSDASLPSTLTVSFLNADTNYEPDTAEATRWSAKHYNPKTMEIGIVTRKDYMKPRVKLWLNEMWAGKEPINVQLPWAWIKYTPGQVYRVPNDDGSLAYFFCENQSIGPVMKNAGRSWDGGIYREMPLSQTTPYDSSGVNAAPPPIPFVVNAVGSEPDDVDVPRLVLAASNQENSWRGAVFVSDDVTGFGRVEITSRARMGVLLTPMPVLQPGLFHHDATVRVQMIHENPASVEEADVNAGANLILLQNGLYFAFTTATQIATGIYDLSGLLVGIYGSDYVEGAEVNTLALFMTDEYGLFDGGFERVEVPRASIGVEIPFSVESLAVDPEGGKITGLEIVPTGDNLKTLPVYLVATQRSGGDVTFTWHYRSRAKDDDYWLTGVPIESTDPEAAVISLQGDGAAANERSVTGATTTFTLAELTAIYGTVPALLSGTIWASNTFAAKGLPRTFEAL